MNTGCDVDVEVGESDEPSDADHAGGGSSTASPKSCSSPGETVLLLLPDCPTTGQPLSLRVPVTTISPLPMPNSGPRKRIAQKAEVLTSTPYKKLAEEASLKKSARMTKCQETLVVKKKGKGNVNKASGKQASNGGIDKQHKSVSKHVQHQPKCVNKSTPHQSNSIHGESARIKPVGSSDSQVQKQSKGAKKPAAIQGDTIRRESAEKVPPK